jgi:uncharacterized membrane protein YjjP (DUF1212 family)
LPNDRSSHERAARSLLLRLGQALHEAGAPAHRIEESMESLARRLGVDGRFFTTPTSIFVGFDAPEESRTAVLRVEPAGVHLGRMSQLDEALDDIESGRLDAEHGVERLEAIAQQPAPYGDTLTVVSFGVSAAVAVFLGGGVREVAAAAAIGLQTGLLAIVAGRVAALNRVFEWIASPAAALAALLWALLFGPLVPDVASLAGLIVLVPGLTLTVAINELASRHLVSGVARLAGAGITFLAIGFGLALAKRVQPLIAEAAASVVANPLPVWAVGLALVLGPLSFTVLFRARRRDAVVVLVTGVVAYLVARGLSGVAGNDIGVLAAAFVLALSGNAYSRFFRRPAAVPIVPGLLMLVPGSLGVRSIGSLFERQAISGVEFAFGMVAVAVALVAGMLFANLVLPPRRAL